VGFYSRCSCAIVGVCVVVYYYYSGVYLGDSDITHHHVYLLMVTTLLLSLTPCGSSFSLDRYSAIKKALETGTPVAPERGFLWASFLIGFQLSMVYFWGAYHKTELSYLSGLRLQQLFMHYYMGADFPPFPGFVPLMFLGALLSLATEYCLAIGLWFKKTQRYLIPIGIAFHLIIYWTLPVQTFSITTILIYLVFMDPDVVHDFFDRYLVSTSAK